jgi:ketosteroid isomerase-like protein
MSKFLTPKDLLDSQVKEFNRGNIDFLMKMYEMDACFASKPGQAVNDLDSIRRTLQDFIHMGAKLEAIVRRVIQASDLALLITEWSINGNEPDGKPINFVGRGTVVLRRQPNGTWLMVIENPWGTE